MSIALIAEVASAHGGDLELARAFIHAYAEAGATYVKFQSYQVKTLRPDDPQREWLAKAELSDDAHHVLIEECQKAGTQFLTTAFTASRLPFLASLGLSSLKLGSGESYILSRSALEAAGWTIFASEGVRPLGRIDGRLKAFACVSRYPASDFACSLIIDKYFSADGWSDHAVGMDWCERAIDVGAQYVEKHVSLPSQKRERRAFECDLKEFARLRQYADAAPSNYEGRWADER